PARAVAAGLDHRGNRLGRAREHRLDRTVAPVADPAFEATRERGVLGPGAKADALYVPAYHYVSDRLIVCRIAAHPTSPVSLARAPRQLSGPQPCSVRISASRSAHSPAAPPATGRKPG